MDYKMLSEKLMNIILYSSNETKRVSYCSKGEEDSEWGYYHTLDLYGLNDILKELGCKSVIDLGCGAGLLMAQLKCINPDLLVSGIDNEPALVEIAKNFIPVKQGDIMNLSKENIRMFDAVYMWCPLKDKVKTKKFVAALIESLVKGQFVICSTEGDLPIMDALIDADAFYEVPQKSASFRVFHLK